MNSINGSAPPQNDCASVKPVPCALNCLCEVGIFLGIGKAGEDLFKGRDFFYACWARLDRQDQLIAKPTQEIVESW